MKNRLFAITALSALAILAGCDAASKSFFTPPDAGTNGGGGVPPAGTGGDSESALVYETIGQFGDVFKLEVSGDGTTVVYVADDDPLGTNRLDEQQIFSITAGSDLPIQLTTDSEDAFNMVGDFDIDENGSQVVFVSDQDLTGDNPTNSFNVFLAATDGSAIAQVTSIASGLSSFVAAGTPRISGDGSTIVFTSIGDLTGFNPGQDRQIFSIDSDGNNLRQVTTGEMSARDIAFSDDGTRIVWEDTIDPLGTNADSTFEIFAINIDGTNLTQLTMSGANSLAPRISDDGSRVVFSSDGDIPPYINDDDEREVYVVNGDGTGLVRITTALQRSGAFAGNSVVQAAIPYGNGAAGAYDISGDGDWVVYSSEGDLVGLNSNITHTIFWSSADGVTTQQLLRPETKPAGVTDRFADQPRTTNDGSVIFFEGFAAYSSAATLPANKIFAHARQ